MKIKKYRERDGLSQKDVAVILKIDRSTVAKWEVGKGYPSIENLKKLSELFNCTIDELVKGGEENG